MTTQHWDVDGGWVAWEKVSLGGFELPGLVDVGGSKSRKVDIKEVKGSDGATITDNGYEPAKVTIDLRIRTPEELATWELVFRVIDPRRKGATSEPWSIAHPAVNMIGITSIFVQTIDVPKLSNGVLSIKLQCVEWFPGPKKQRAGAGKSTGSIASQFAAAPKFTVVPPSESPAGPGPWR